jgi:nucleoside-diphosphate-sugar epimerase
MGKVLQCGKISRSLVFMRILIAGGTGFIGSEIAKAISAEKNHELIILSRVSDRIGDVTKAETLKKKFDDIDIVIHCVQFPNHPVQNPAKGYTYEKYDAEGTENICYELKNTKVQRIIYISGAGTDSLRQEPWFKAKVRAEKAVKETGKEYIILRPSWVYGPHDRSMNKFIEFAKNLPMMPVIGDGKSRVSPVFVKDLAQLCLRAITTPPKAHETLDVGGPEVLTMNDIQRLVLKLLGKNKPLVHQPLWLMKIAGSVMEKVLPTPPLSAEAVDFVNMDIPVDGGPAEKIFNYKMKSLEEALKSYL